MHGQRVWQHTARLDLSVLNWADLQGGARKLLGASRTLQQAKDTTLDSISEEDEFSDLGVLDDSNSMYMVGLLLCGSALGPKAQ